MVEITVPEQRMKRHEDIPSLRISCFSKELKFQLVGNSIRDQDLNTRCTLSVERARKYMYIYTRM